MCEKYYTLSGGIRNLTPDEVYYGLPHPFAEAAHASLLIRWLRDLLYAQAV